MATSRKKLREQVLRRLKGGDPSVASNVHELEVDQAIMQVLNSRLRTQYFEGLQLGENIPDGCLIATYDNVPVVSWNGVSKSTLPAIPISLPKNIGIWRITPVPYTVVKLSQPTITATAASDTQIDVVVGTVANALSYQVDRSTDLNNWVTISNSAVTIHDTGRTASTTYYYRVKAVCNGTTYTDSDYKYATAKTNDPLVQLSTPQNVTATIISTFVSFNWDDVTNGTSYDWQVASDNLFSNISDSGNSSTSDANSLNLTPGSIFYFRCKAKANGFSDSGWSSPISFGGTKLTTPVLSFTSVSSSGFTVNWTPDSNANQMDVDIATDSGFSTIIGSGSGSNSGNYMFASGTTGQTYYVRVRQRSSPTWFINSDYGTANQTLL